MLDSLEKMLTKGMDNALLRFGLGKGYLDLGDFPRAAEHLQRCVEFDPKYSAAWKLLGKAHRVLNTSPPSSQHTKPLWRGDLSPLGCAAAPKQPTRSV